MDFQRSRFYRYVAAIEQLPEIICFVKRCLLLIDLVADRTPRSGINQLFTKPSNLTASQKIQSNSVWAEFRSRC
jgi:hypothetical protein